MNCERRSNAVEQELRTSIFLNALTMSWHRKLKIKRFASVPIQREIGTEIANEISPASLKLFGSNSEID